ncbi:MAG: shikimate kinase [Acidobacteriota bacterium]|nr:shikimate kinase [Acidobacteriota bacterium]
MNLYGVGGRPVLHSKSPLVHAHIFGRAGCRSIRIGADTAEELAGLVRSAGILGLNVTAPFKRSIMPLLDGLDASASAVGAVNTVVNSSGHLTGFNTDPDGVLFALKQKGIRPAGLRILVLGAGGAGRAAAASLVRNGGRVTVANRTDDVAKSCAAAFRCGWTPFSGWVRRLDAFDLLVNTVPVSAENATPPSNLIVLDALYAKRPFAPVAARRGCVYIPGEAWLFGQALASCRLWRKIRSGCLEPAGCGEPPARLFKPLYPARKIRRVALAGIMGAGKSTVGRLLAGSLGRPFIDMDALIAERERMSISEIFRRRGENVFRAVETEILQTVLQTPPAVLALGGGAVLRPENRAALRRNSLVVWIHAAPDAAWKRVSGAGRPLLENLPGREAFRNLCARRMRFYADAADLMISGEKSPEHIARHIHEDIHQTLQD